MAHGIFRGPPEELDALIEWRRVTPAPQAHRLGQQDLQVLRLDQLDYGLDVYGAYFRLTQAGRVRLGNIVDPKYTLGASILKRCLLPYQ
jgi:hypothetical protein